jgi:chromosomal replication initiator protein
LDQYNAEAIWREALVLIARTINEGTYRIWFEPTVGLGFSDDTFVIGVPSDFAKDWIDTRFHALITDSVSQVVGDAVSCRIVVSPELAGVLEDEQRTAVQAGVPAEPTTADTEAPPDGDDPDDLDVTQEVPAPRFGGSRPSPRAGSGVGLNEKYSFDSFVIGNSNRFAHAAALAAAESPGTTYNPLFIYGGVGLGKTHLLQAIGHFIVQNAPYLKVRFVTIEMFTNDFINSVRDDQMEGFKRRYRQNDVLLIDDLQFLERKEQTQEEFFHTFNTLHDAGRQIVLSSDRPPKALITLERRLQSRFEAGLITDIQPPDLETRIAILRKKVQVDRTPLADDAVLSYIAARVPSNIRELEGCLVRVVAYANIEGRPIDLPLARAVLKDIPETANTRITCETVLTAVSERTGISIFEIKSDKRTRNIVRARHIVMYLTRELTDLSLPKIGERLGGRDHTTVLHGVDKVTRVMHEDRELYDLVQELTATLKSAQ